MSEPLVHAEDRDHAVGAGPGADLDAVRPGAVRPSALRLSALQIPPADLVR
jgi:hypothetical protein